MVDAPAPFRIQFDNARDPYTARNALGILGTGGSGGGAPIDAQYIVAVDDPTLTNDRVLTNTATVTWDLTTPGQVKANAVSAAPGAWAAFTPTVAASAGTLTAASATGRFLQNGKNVHFSMRITITTNGTGATAITATLPVTAFAATQALASYHETNNEVMAAVILSSSPTLARLRNSAGEYPGANGAVFIISGTYEAA